MKYLIDIKGIETEFTEEEAKRLYEELRKVYGVMPYFPQLPINPYPYITDYKVTCGTSMT